MKDKKGAVYVPIYLDWLETTQDLSADEKGHLIDAVVMYAAEKDEWIDQLETSGEKIAFRFMRGQVDRNKAISKARSRARTGETETNENKQEQNGTNDKKEEQNGTKVPKEIKKEKEKDIDKEIKKRFIPPTIDEVSDYCKGRNNGIDAEYFVSYYQKQDWFLSNGRKMKDWKAAIITWEKNDKKRHDVPVKKVVAQNYEQRGYDDEQAEAMRRMLEGVRA